MRKIIITCGLIAGLISIAWGIVNANFLETGVSYNMRLVGGFAAMIVGFSFIFVGVKNYRDNQNGGAISFGQALKISLLITLVASTVYVLIWMIDFYFFLPNFTKDMLESARQQLAAEGKTAVQIQTEMTATTSMMESYHKPLILILYTYMEIAPLGIVMSLIASAVLTRKTKVAKATA